MSAPRAYLSSGPYTHDHRAYLPNPLWVAMREAVEILEHAEPDLRFNGEYGTVATCHDEPLFKVGNLRPEYRALAESLERWLAQEER